jgi:hypothetical protein
VTVIPLYVIEDSPPAKLKPLAVTMLLGNRLKAFMVMPADPVSKASGKLVDTEPTLVIITNMRGLVAYPTGYKLTTVGCGVGGFELVVELDPPEPQPVRAATTGNNKNLFISSLSLLFILSVMTGSGWS